MKHQKKYILNMLALVLIFIGLLQNMPVQAAGAGTGGSISIVCPVEGMKLSLYRVADYGTTGRFTLTGAFSGYSVSLKHSDQTGWQGAADTLANYAVQDGISADAEQVSGTDKNVKFSGLTRGLYLIAGQKTEKVESGKTQVYTPQVTLIALPGEVHETDPYNRTAVLKYGKNEKAEAGGSTSSKPAEKVPSENTSSGNPSSENVVSENVASGETQKLPQTGQLWWPVPLLLLAAVICLLLRRTSKHWEVVLLLAAAVMLISYNLWDSYRAEQSQEMLLEEYLEETSSTSEELGEEVPDDYEDPEMEMPEVKLDSLEDGACIGILEIPSLDLKLPVISKWSYPLLKKAPCRYSGSVYENNLVIAAHNYRSHFGRLKTLQNGSEVIFTDVAGNQFEYYVTAVEALSAQSVEDMTSGEWPLSLFTCTVDGKNRVTVRCDRKI